jgi:hypothetical protein
MTITHQQTNKPKQELDLKRFTYLDTLVALGILDQDKLAGNVCVKEIKLCKL